MSPYPPPRRHRPPGTSHRPHQRHHRPHRAPTAGRGPYPPALSGKKFHLGLALTAGLALSMLIASLRRVRRLRAALDHALHQAHHDLLTGLPNREAALTHLATGPVDLVALMDLDDFKNVNDRYGHHVGDGLLNAIAQRLKTAIKGQGIAARLAGDEFLLIWTLPVAHPLRQASALLETVCTPLAIDGHHLTPSASLGLARPGPHLHTPALLIRAADHAMYAAKHTGPHPPADDAVPGPRARLYRGPYPPAPSDRDLSGRRTTRDRGPNETAEISSSPDEVAEPR